MIYLAKTRAHEGQHAILDVDTAIRRLQQVRLTADQCGGKLPDVGIVGEVWLTLIPGNAFAPYKFEPLKNTTENQARAFALSLILEKRRMIQVCSEGLSGHLVQLVSDECDAIAAKHRDQTGEDVGLNTDDTLDLDDEDVLKVLWATVTRIKARLRVAESLVTGDEAATR